RDLTVTGVQTCALPISGGTRLKTLAAMASMVPVVTTPIGSEGYGAIKGKSILVGENAEELAAQAVKVLRDKKLYVEIAENARKQIGRASCRERVKITVM